MSRAKGRGGGQGRGGISTGGYSGGGVERMMTYSRVVLGGVGGYLG